MAVKIRLRRMGAKKAPFYRVVICRLRYPRNSRFIEEIGTYNPLTDPTTVNIDTQGQLRSGSQTVLSQLILLRLF